MTLEDDVQKLEKYYFDKYVKTAVDEEYIDSSTWRGFSSKFKTPDAASHALLYSYDHITIDLETFLDAHPSCTAEEFDAFHHRQVEDLRVYLNIQTSGDQILASATGEFYTRAYNSYAKVVDLANKTWFIKVMMNIKSKYYDLLPRLRRTLHVPLDTHVHIGLRDLIVTHELPKFDLPKGGMGTVKSQEKYAKLQDFVRTIAEGIPSARFEGEEVAPIVFDAYYQMSRTDR